jgi:hypothetical protein
VRVLFVWVTCLAAMATVTLGWLIGSSIVTSIASSAMGDLTGSPYSLLKLVEFVAAWWGPIFDVIILLWAIINSQEVDPNSRFFG